jgi:hypothetical protein
VCRSHSYLHRCEASIPIDLSGFDISRWKPKLHWERAAVTDLSLPCWMCHLGALGPPGATCSRWLDSLALWSREADAGSAAPDGGGLSRQRPRPPMHLWSYEVGAWPSAVLGGDLRLCRQRVSSTCLVRQCEDQSGCYVGATVGKAWCLGGDLEICVMSMLT